MMDLKLWLSILMVCEMAESIGSGKSWLISVPSKIPVLESSCVVIPCEYDYPTKGNLWKKWRGYWTRGDETVASNNPKFKLKQEFKGRSRITGTIESNDCTWQLDDVRETDTGPFHLTIEIPRHSKFIFSKDPVTLDVFRVPEPPVMTVSVNNHASATCTVTHACPSSPPKFSWSHPGKTKTSSKKLKEGLWSTKSTLTFTPEEADFNKPLKCTVNFNDKKTTEGSVLLVKKST
ncbi:sialic acid-binding Ig-like lectin 14 [Poecilia latipinna]|uniref:sialic acid-binding Ig-like lectin 14 n=1 Tax=Poecilia mexicana TaxID=48701 RepID=UPI00072DB21E|nr:PREDICTED: sialic acid-binding Ig-like lectin 14 [Poecilia mexicana]XP_014875865.1 PREDICTED: sialic acid-binding Ig-like lectin 14 [Poecilia latipinna]XP_014881515.1 PREDICTED: sialic acid-binding Ig-like lectin 14 [Poecilia latipinna]XP_014881516.1 PREDICTED: sialic acid-binding Ig-like lectin 14 [Poecilia latipinna]